MNLREIKRQAMSYELPDYVLSVAPSAIAL
jgi:hypothetical protein